MSARRSRVLVTVGSARALRRDVESPTAMAHIRFGEPFAAADARRLPPTKPDRTDFGGRPVESALDLGRPDAMCRTLYGHLVAAAQERMV